MENMCTQQMYGIPISSINLISLAIVFGSNIRKTPSDRPPLDTQLLPLSETNDTLLICKFVSHLLFCVCVWVGGWPSGVCVGGGM